MIRSIFILFFMWVFHSRAHLESQSDFFLLPKREVMFTDDTPVEHGEIAGAEVKTGQRPWRRPQFSSQTQALGYNEKAFSIPKGLEVPVRFWIDIYTKYPSTQGLIHDSENIDLIYEVVDFSEINNSKELSSREKEKNKKRLVNEAKERASEILARLERNPDYQTLSVYERRVADYMKTVSGDKKYREANDKNRIRFQLGQADRMKQALYFSGRYLEEFEEIFRQEGLPIELTRLVFVESSFNVLARSKVGASGLWQIMPSVARPHRMITSFVDRRNDPWDATKLAAKVLAGNYRLLGHWPLAITGYNHGPNGVKKMVEKYQTTDIVDLIENVRSRRSFGFASRNFYPSFLAALEVEKNASSYFPGIQWSQKLNLTPYKTPVAVSYKDLVKAFDNHGSQMEIYNPHLTHQVKNKGMKIPVGTKIYIPTDHLSALEKKLPGRNLASKQE